MSKAISICTTWSRGYQVDQVELGHKIIPTISDFKVKPLCKTTRINVILEDEIIAWLATLNRIDITLNTDMRFAD